MPRVSVICAAFNMEKVFSFRDSISSILTQTFYDFELIACDDGSTDRTFDILTEYARADGRIKLLKNSANLGLAASLNRCIEYSSGEYIARHDFDDLSHPQRLCRQVEYLDKNPSVDILGTGVFLFDKNGVYSKRSFPKEVRGEDFLFSSPFMHGSVMMRRNALLAVGGYRVSRLTRRTEDYELFMRLCRISRGENLRERLYFYLEDEDTKKRRRYRYRIDEAIIRARGFYSLGLLPRGILYVVKPLIVGLIPGGILNLLKRIFLRR